MSASHQGQRGLTAQNHQTGNRRNQDHAESLSHCLKHHGGTLSPPRRETRLDQHQDYARKSRFHRQNPKIRQKYRGRTYLAENQSHCFKTGLWSCLGCLKIIGLQGVLPMGEVDWQLPQNYKRYWTKKKEGCRYECKTRN